MSWLTWLFLGVIVVQAACVFHALNDRMRLTFVVMVVMVVSISVGFVRAARDHLEDQQDCARIAADLGPDYQCVIEVRP